MKLIAPNIDLSGMDCHIHSAFSPDARESGADEPQRIADAVRAKRLRGFIVTDHLDFGHWNGYIIDFDAYFRVWERVRKDNSDLTIYIGLEVGFERRYVKDTASIISDLPLDYVINSVHYWADPTHNRISPRRVVYAEYLDAVRAALDAPYPFSAVAHLGFPERYALPDAKDRKMFYRDYARAMDGIISAAIARDAAFEINTNCGNAELYLPRIDFLRAYKAAGGRKPMLGSDAHTSAAIGRRFDEAAAMVNEVFG